MSHSAPSAPGRRSTRRGFRPDVTTVLAVGLPVLCALALLLVQAPGALDADHPPTRVALTRATLVCPSAVEDADDVALTSAADDAQGQVQVGLGDELRTADLAAGRVTTVSGLTGPAAVAGEDETAPGLVAGRFGGREPTAVACSAPAPHAWFTGVGAGAGHTSVLELANPDSGTAVADITVYGRGGVVDAPRLRGVSVPGGTSVRLDLGSVIPRRDELAIEVVASRGRLGASVLDRYDEVGAAELTQDWLPAQAEPATDNLLMGLAPGGGRRTLVVANGTDDEVRADVRVVTDDSVFAPKGLHEIRIAPQSVQRVAVSHVLGPAISDGATGLLVTATAPVTATLRSFVEGDLSHAVADQTLDGPATVLLPEGGKGVAKTVQLAGATRTGAVTVVARSASGQELDSTRVDITPDRGVTVKLPADAVLVTVTPERTTLAGAVLVSGKGKGRAKGAAVVPLTTPELNGLVPDVRPGLP
ncbi:MULTISPECIES: DUF5719 family protein [unclassified Nocardioides]|uniref:DUF5719 family protein n=1 Tax=unclassified Nocardioides TaxID=2615069 RepID=UPI0000570C15|nr:MULTISPECIES: DUF5719 family protein [unclassified Nocardioides]ABL80927.1 hypothetical protein Noca_1413 [Nocardioides sp. JS614]